MAREVFVVGAARTAIGSFAGALRHVELADLAATTVGVALARAEVDLRTVGLLVMGTVVPTHPRDAYLSRMAALQAGLGKEVDCYNVNSLCGSGLQAIACATQKIARGDGDVAVGAGAESMSRGACLLPSLRDGACLGDATALDCVLGTMQDPFKNVHMGITAENIAAQFGIARETQDALALESQRRAVRAMVEGRFKEQIAAVSVSLNGVVGTFDQDEHVRPNLTIEQLAAMKPVFKEGGSVTSGNASGINDGSAAIVLASASAVRTQDLVPMARVVSFGHVAVDPALMGMGPVPASRLALRRAGLQVRDMDVIECNESSAAQASAVAQALEFNPDRVNPNGSGIALGHPIGATGAILVTKAIYELHRTGGRYALITLCIGGGQGIAAIFERA